MANMHVDDYRVQKIPSPLNGVHVWKARIDVEPSNLDRLAALLSRDERDWGAPSSRRSGHGKFIATRGLLRVLLGTYLGIEPVEIQFEYGDFGKPYLTSPQPAQGICFNLSHSGGIALVAVSSNRRVGVDIECLKFGRAISDLVAQSLTERERQKWSNAIPSDRRNIFYRYWVRKEAYLKGVGSGLTSPIHRVDVSNCNPLGNHLVTTPVSDGFECPWKIYDLQIPGSDDVVAALAIENVDPVAAACGPGIEPKSTSAGVLAGEGRIQCPGTRSLNTSVASRCNRI